MADLADTLIDTILDRIDDALNAGRFDEVDADLRDTHPWTLTAEQAEAVLIATLAAESRLTHRALFAELHATRPSVQRVIDIPSGETASEVPHG